MVTRAEPRIAVRPIANRPRRLITTVLPATRTARPAVYAVAMVARCAPADRFFVIIHTYFRSQEKWLSSQDLRGAILELAKPFGFTEQSFEACLSNQALFEGLENVRSRGAAFGVQATPTFFINGRKMEGALSLDDLQKAIDPLL